MIDNLRITYLADVPEHAALCARWAFDVWGQYNPGNTMEMRIETYKKHAQKEALPISWLAMDGDTPVGMASLRMKDGTDHPELYPWLGSLYIHEKYRGQGIAQELIKVVMMKAALLNHKQVYLLTFEPSLAEWYEGLGWKQYEKSTYSGAPITIMRFAL